MKIVPYLLAVLFLGLMAVAWFLFQADDSELQLQQQDLVVVEDHQQPQRSPDLSVVQSAQESVAAVPELTEAAASEPIVLAEGEESILVRVIDGKTKKAVSGFDVYVFGEEIILQLKMLRGESVYEAIVKLADHYRCNDQGEVRIRRLAGRLQVMAYSDSQLGMAQIERNDKDVEVELTFYPTVQVLVVDTDQKPIANAQVVARVHRRERGDGYSRDLAAARTSSPDGRAQVLFQSFEKRRERSRYAVALAGLFETPVEVDIDIDNPPSETITLVKPAVGGISVLLKNAAGVAVTETRHMGSVSRQGPKGSETLRRYSSEDWAMFMINEGRGEFECLELGKDWEVTVRPGPDGTFKEMTQVVVGPQREGEIVEVVFDLPEVPTRCIITGIALDESGQALVGQLLKAHSQVRQGSGYHSKGASTTTGSDGSFTVSFDPEEETLEASWWISVAHSDQNGLDHKFEQNFTGRGAGYYDLGEITLCPDPVLVRGRVLGPDGQGLSLIHVSLRELHSDDAKEQQRRGPFRNLQANSDSDGNFEVRGDSKASRFQLNAGGQGFQFSGVEVHLGQEGVIVQMVAQARLKARFLPSEGNDSSFLKGYIMDLRKDGGDRRGGSGLAENGVVDTYEEAGNYDLLIRHESDLMQVVFEQKNLVLVAGETLDLGEIKMPSAGIRVALEINFNDVDGKHRNVAGRMRLYPLGEQHPKETYIHVRDESHVFFVEELPIDVEIELPGFRVKRWTLTKRRETIVLDRGIEVNCRVNGLGGLPENAIAALSLDYLAEGAEGSSRRRHYGRSGDRSTFDCKDPETTQFVTRPGLYEVRVSVGFRIGNRGSHTSGLPQTEALTISVLDKSSPQTFSINLDPEVVATALKTLKEQR